MDADLGQAAANRLPAGRPPHRQRGFADSHDVAGGQFPGRFGRVAPAREYDLESDTAAGLPPLDDSLDELRVEPG